MFKRNPYDPLGQNLRIAQNWIDYFTPTDWPQLSGAGKKEEGDRFEPTPLLFEGRRLFAVFGAPGRSRGSLCSSGSLHLCRWRTAEVARRIVAKSRDPIRSATSCIAAQSEFG